MPNRWLLEAGMPNANLEAWGALPIVRRLQPPAEPTSDRGAGFETGCEVAPLETHCVSDGRNSALASISSRQGGCCGCEWARWEGKELRNSHEFLMLNPRQQ